MPASTPIGSIRSAGSGLEAEDFGNTDPPNTRDRRRTRWRPTGELPGGRLSLAGDGRFCPSTFRRLAAVERSTCLNNNQRKSTYRPAPSAVATAASSHWTIGCGLGRTLAPSGGEPAATVAGRTATLDAAIEAAANILSAARYPLVVWLVELDMRNTAGGGRTRRSVGSLFRRRPSPVCAAVSGSGDGDLLVRRVKESGGPHRVLGRSAARDASATGDGFRARPPRAGSLRADAVTAP